MSVTSLILMATYNGEKYISQQIESIIKQTNQNWRLLIRDDGSQDSTVSIILKYVKHDERIVLFQNETSFHGAYLNFWTLINEARKYYSDYDYYFFSDQDDVWESDKLATMLNEAANENKNIPLLVYSDMRVIDEDHRIVYNSLNSVMGIGKMSGYSLLFTHGFLWGCDICVNQALFNTVPLLSIDHPHINIMSHDNYMGKYALLTGKIKYINRAMINHRRHSSNTTGEYSMKLNLLRIIKRGILQIDDLAKTHARVYNQTLIFLNEMKHDINVTSDKMMSIEKAIRSGGFQMVHAMWKMGVKRKQHSRTLGIYYIAVTGKYKKYLIV